ncbi:MAG: recombinase family protein [Devosia sp.]
MSTKEQRPDRQVDGLRGLCDELHVERLSAVSDHRPIFETVLRRLKRGDTLLVWDLDRAFRSTADAIVHDEQLRGRGVCLKAVNFVVDTLTADGNYAYQVNAAAAERERRKISERTREGLAAARARGVRLGRPPKLSEEQVRSAQLRIALGTMTLKDIARQLRVHPWTLTRSIKRFDRGS